MSNLKKCACSAFKGRATNSKKSELLACGVERRRDMKENDGS